MSSRSVGRWWDGAPFERGVLATKLLRDRMNAARALLLLVSAALLVSCSKRADSVEATLKAVGPEQLRHDAAVIYKQAFSARGTRFVVIPKNAWPASFRRFQPIRVGAYLDGCSLTLATTPQTESGVYVVPLHMERVPAENAGTRFEKLADGIFRYTFTN